jgi:hypothetical protein
MFIACSPTYKFQITFENGKFLVEGKDFTGKKENVNRQVETAEEVAEIIGENIKTWFSLSTTGFNQIFNDHSAPELVMHLESLKTPVGYMVYHPELKPRYFTASLTRVAEIKAKCEATYGRKNEWKYVVLVEGARMYF